MDGISSTPIENSVQFLRLRDKYKSNLLDDSRLTKAAGLAAQKELLLESPAPDTWKEPRLKSVNQELQWVKKIRQPGGTRGISRDEDDSDDENLAVGPLQHFMGNISKISKAIKRKAEPVTPQSVLQTPVVKQTPSTSKKPKLTFKTESKAKRLLPKTPKKTPSSGYKTPKKEKTPSPPSSVFSTAEEEEGFAANSLWKKARESIEKKFNEASKRATERALKKLAPAPGWKPFGTPAKRRLDGKDW
ncbi:unnamed protein product [Porites evermanni]|uniref:Uncharacterized protein n=1 Tax=Porites evermanni TaxID=104178 RepID=A0ABN8MCX1_9CNID|nr:unnamed protein product [Porites evermanni]CAH3027259.1 unnamed protein product [Porites evermanni]